MIKITDAFLGEHAVFYAWFDALEPILDLGGQARLSTPDLHRHADLLAGALVSHAQLENGLLFDAVDARRPAHDGPVAAMRREHDDIEGMLAKARESGDAERIRRLLLEVIVSAREHFEKEEVVGFPLAEEVLEQDELVELGRRWAAERSVRLGGA